jgi:aspartyl/asparaginyl beta-hydroxylase (cupin superfamily)
MAWDKGGDWWNYPLVLNDTIVPGRTRELCPQTCQLLSRIRGIKVAGFSKLNTGGYIHPHRDTHGMPKCLAYHLGLLGRGELTASGHDTPLVQEGGKDFIIDTELEHSVVNVGCTDRIILYILFHKDQHVIPI